MKIEMSLTLEQEQVEIEKWAAIAAHYKEIAKASHLDRWGEIEEKEAERIAEAAEEFARDVNRLAGTWPR